VLCAWNTNLLYVRGDSGLQIVKVSESIREHRSKPALRHKRDDFLSQVGLAMIDILPPDRNEMAIRARNQQSVLVDGDLLPLTFICLIDSGDNTGNRRDGINENVAAADKESL
jgi:hypothetical protein